MPHLVLYDGACGLCDRSVQFLLTRDRKDVFRFAALQSALAKGVLERHGRDPLSLDTMVLVADYGTPNERALVKSRAAAFALEALGGGWRAFSLGRLLPRALTDALYALVARHRQTLFGPNASCRVMDEKTRAKFLDAPGPSPS